jgi:hypothetical protein
MEEALKLQFEQIFVKHYERLTTSQQSVGGLSFTLDNIICFILLGGRELAIEDIYGDVSERYSMETFITDTREAGLEMDEHLQKTVSDMVAKKFLHLQADGHFYSYQATRDTARMFNKIYPNMQGMSMLAYIGQTIQEVETGRVDLETALSRFDQTLQKQGVPLPKAKIPVIAPPPKPIVAPQKVEELKHSSSKIFRDYVVTNTTVKAKVEKPLMPDDLVFEPPVEVSPEPRAPEPETPIESNAIKAHSEPEVEKAPVAPPTVEPKEEPAPEEPEVVDDDAIAAKIAAFEKELALVCPSCKTSVLKEEKTAGGKLFYSCTSDKCNFISWGRPHQIPCPRCKNPFMVEVADNEGNMILKCPRATCQHRQAMTATAPPAAGGVKKVVRKRLVRRKV